MRFRIQQTVRSFWRERYVFCLQADVAGPWRCQEVNRRQLDKHLSQLGFADHRDAFEIFSKIDFAERHYGLGGGYVEHDLDGSQERRARRFEGDPRQDRT